jgi:hypothetical protein
MRLLSLLCALALAAPLAGCSPYPDSADDGATSEDPLAATDTKVKNAVLKTTKDLSFMSESDHPFIWVRSSETASGRANAAFVHRAFNGVTNGDAMADKPLSALKSETVGFEAFAARFVPAAGQDPDNLAYNQKMTAMLKVLRANLKDPVVVRLGRTSSSGLVGAISVYVIGTLPSGKIGGVFTVSVET